MYFNSWEPHKSFTLGTVGANFSERGTSEAPVDYFKHSRGVHLVGNNTLPNFSNRAALYCPRLSTGPKEHFTCGTVGAMHAVNYKFASEGIERQVACYSLLLRPPWLLVVIEWL